MRPLRLLVALSSCVIAITVLLYISIPSQPRQIPAEASGKKKGVLSAFFSFGSPSSLFPPSAIISLTDDNSTFFLARPAAFGPTLPSKGLSGQLWVGNGFGDNSLGNGGMTASSEGELGCSDVPGWSDDNANIQINVEVKKTDTAKSAVKNVQAHNVQASPKSSRSKRSTDEDADSVLETEPASDESSENDDGTDDYLHYPLPDSGAAKAAGEGTGTKDTDHADIQSLQESAEIAGKIVLLSRGGCGFLEKVKWAQRRGGVAVIVGDDVRGGPLVTMYARGDTSNVTIPALFTSHTTAHLLSSLIPSGGIIGELSADDLRRLAEGKGQKAKTSGKEGTSSKGVDNKSGSTGANGPGKPGSKSLPTSSQQVNTADQSQSTSWIRSFFSFFGLCSSGKSSGEDTRRPPSSGNIDWIQIEDWNGDDQVKLGSPSKSNKKGSKKAPTSTKMSSDDFVIGVQDWRDPDLLPQQTSSSQNPSSDGTNEQSENSQLKGGSILPGSGEYEKPSNNPVYLPSSSHSTSEKASSKDSSDGNRDGGKEGWLSHLIGSNDRKESQISGSQSGASTGSQGAKPASENLPSPSKGNPEDPNHREGLWVTLTPTSMTSSPFIDTLLVLVVSPLVTLTVVYALLLLRARIRRRRWRAPKSVVERLPVRTYHTLSNDTTSANTPLSTPAVATPTTPLLHSSSRSSLPRSRPRSRTASEVPAQTSSSFHSNARQRSTSPEQEKREAGLAQWRRRYGGRQKECVVCLEEYVDGVSRVMSLPCGHEFHAECITPWLTTRRRTCPICKGDVVRSMARQNSHTSSSGSIASSSHSRHHQLRRQQSDSPEGIQAQAAENRNDSPSASLPIPSTPDDDEEIYEEPDLERAQLVEDDGESEDSSDSSREEGQGWTSRIWTRWGSWVGGNEARHGRERDGSPDRDR